VRSEHHRRYVAAARHRASTRAKPKDDLLKRHWDFVVAADFFTVEVSTRRGLTRFLVLFFIDIWKHEK